MNENGKSRDFEQERMERIESAMKHEGAASWSMERANDPKIILKPVSSQFVFKDKSNHITYCK